MGKRRVMRYENSASGEDLPCKTVDVWYSVLQCNSLINFHVCMRGVLKL